MFRLTMNCETIELKEIIFSLSPRVKTFNIYIEEIDSNL
jgi:hypothetical protein